MSSIVVAHIKGYDPTPPYPAEKTLYFSDSPYITDNLATNAPPGATWGLAYVDRLMQPGLFERNCFESGTLGGEASLSFGTLDILNNDGVYDYLMDWGFDGRTIEIYYGSVAPGTVPSWTLVFSGTMIDPIFERDLIKFRLRDNQIDLDIPVCINQYGGSNVLPNGMDGTDDIAGQRKPKAYGKPRNVKPVLVNTSKLIYQCSDEPIATLWTTLKSLVYDSGAEIPRETPEYTSEADMMATAPTAGKVRIWLGGGSFRLGSAPMGEVTCTPTTDANDANLTAAKLFYKIATVSGGISPSAISSADLTALDVANSSPLALFFQDDTTIRDAFNKIARSVGAWWGFDKTSVLRIARLEVPSGTPEFTLTDSEMFKITKISTSEDIPYFQVNLGFDENFTIQTSGLAGSVDPIIKNRLGQQYLQIRKVSAGVKTKHLLSKELNLSTNIQNPTNAGIEANRILALYNVQRRTFEIHGFCDTEKLSKIDLGKVVQIQSSRFMLSNGKLFRILGYALDLRLKTFKLRCWG